MVFSDFSILASKQMNIGTKQSPPQYGRLPRFFGPVPVPRQRHPGAQKRRTATVKSGALLNIDAVHARGSRPRNGPPEGDLFTVECSSLHVSLRPPLCLPAANGSHAGVPPPPSEMTPRGSRLRQSAC